MASLPLYVFLFLLVEKKNASGSFNINIKYHHYLSNGIFRALLMHILQSKQQSFGP